MADDNGTAGEERDMLVDVMPGVSWEEGEKLDYATIAKAGGRRGANKSQLPFN